MSCHPNERAGLLNLAGELKILNALQLVDCGDIGAVFRFQVIAQPVGSEIAGDIDGRHIGPCCKQGLLIIGERGADLIKGYGCNLVRTDGVVDVELGIAGDFIVCQTK